MSYKSIAIIAAVVIVLAGGGIYYWLSRTPNEAPSSETENTPVTEGEATSTATSTPASTSAPAKKPAASTPALSYEEAVTLFGGRRIQFDPQCNMEPSSITFKNGTSVMLDNRGPARIIALDDINYSISAYGFKILTLRSRTLPHVIRVDCGAGVNNGQIILQ